MLKDCASKGKYKLSLTRIQEKSMQVDMRLYTVTLGASAGGLEAGTV